MHFIFRCLTPFTQLHSARGMPWSNRESHANNFPSCLPPVGSGLLSTITKVHDSQGLVLYRTNSFSMFGSRNSSIWSLKHVQKSHAGQREALTQLWFRELHRHVDRLRLFFKTLFWRKVKQGHLWQIFFQKSPFDFLDGVMIHMAKCSVIQSLQRGVKNFIIWAKMSKGKWKSVCLKVNEKVQNSTLESGFSRKKKSNPSLPSLYILVVA